ERTIGSTNDADEAFAVGYRGRGGPEFDSGGCKRRCRSIPWSLVQGLSARQDSTGKREDYAAGWRRTDRPQPKFGTNSAGARQFSRRGGQSCLGGRKARSFRRPAYSGGRQEPEHLGSRRDSEREDVRRPAEQPQA